MVIAEEGPCCYEDPGYCIPVCYTPAYFEAGEFSLTVDFLYWYASESNLGYAIENKRVTEDFLAVNEIHSIGVEWKPGVRAGLGYVTCHDGFDLNFLWTYYRNESHSSTSVPPFSGAVPDLGGVALSDPWSEIGALSNEELTQQLYDKISGKWVFCLNNLDFELGRRYYLSACFTMRPYIALRGSWIDTDFTVSSQPKTQEAGAVMAVISQENKFDNRFWGAGFLAGFQPVWFFTPCFSFFGTADIALLWGNHSVRKKIEVFQATSTEGTLADFSFHSDKSSFYSMQGILDLGLGFRYEMIFCDCYRAALDLGWEHHIYFDLNQRYKSNYIQTQHDVGLGGFVLRALFAF